MATGALLELKNISKKFGTTVANDSISLTLQAGEVVGLLGENGAGKTTLMNILSGLISPDEGEVWAGNRRLDLSSPREAIRYGIGMVHQHFMLVSALSVVENIALGDDRLPRWRVPLDCVAKRIVDLSVEIGMPVDPKAKIADLGVGLRQRVEIIKALSRGARVLILDEPTTVLTEVERSQLYTMIRKLRVGGTAIVLISHKLDDIYEVCDRVVVLRRGRVVDAASIGQRSAEELIRRMIGDDLPTKLSRPGKEVGAIIMSVRDLIVRRQSGPTAFNGISFDLHMGEILALGGVEGNGQEELAEAIMGLLPVDSGSIVFRGRQLARTVSTRARRELGLRHVPHDRLSAGVLLGRSLTENLLLTHWFDRALNHWGWINRRKARQCVRQIGRLFNLSRRSPDSAMTSLSGGNQQKLVVGREMLGDLRALVAAHPTRGLDVRTVDFLQEQLVKMREQGVAVLLISSDLNEIWQMADRIMVLAQGRLRGPVQIAKTNITEVGSWIAGR